MKNPFFLKTMCLIVSLWCGVALSEPPSKPQREFHPGFSKYTQDFKKELADVLEKNYATLSQYVSQTLDSIVPFSSKTIIEAFQPYCAFNEKEIIHNEPFKYGFWDRKQMYSCHIVLTLLQWGAYKFFNSKESLDLNSYEHLSDSYGELAFSLSTQFPKNFLYKKTEVYALIIRSDIKLQKILRGLQKNEEKLSELNQLVFDFSTLDLISEQDILYDAKILYASFSIERALLTDVVTHKKTKKELLKWARKTLKQAYEITQQKGFKFSIFPLHTSLFIQKNFDFVRKELKKLGEVQDKEEIKKTSESSVEAVDFEENMDATLAQLLAGVDEEQLSKAEEEVAQNQQLTSEEEFGSVFNKDMAAKIGSSNMREQFIEDIQRLAQKMIEEQSKYLKTEFTNQEDWHKHYTAQAIIAVLKDHLLGRLRSFSYPKLEGIHKALMAESMNEFPWVLMHVIYDSKKLLGLKVFSEHPFSDFMIIKNIVDLDTDSEKVMTKQHLKKFVYDALSVMPFGHDKIAAGSSNPRNDNDFFHAEADQLISKLYQHAVPSIYVLENSKGHQTLDGIYQQWLMEQLVAYEEKNFKNYQDSQSHYEQVEGIVLRRILLEMKYRSFATEDKQDDRLNISQLNDFLKTAQEKKWDDYVELRIKTAEAKTWDSLQFEKPVENLVHLELRRRFLGLKREEYQTVIESRVLLSVILEKCEGSILKKEGNIDPSPSAQDDKLNLTLRGALEFLGYHDITVSFLFENLGENGTSLEEVYLKYLHQKFLSLLKTWEEKESKDFETKMEISLLSKIDEGYIKSNSPHYSKEILLQLISVLEKTYFDLSEVLKLIPTELSWLEADVAKNEEKFVWFATLYDMFSGASSAPFNDKAFQEELEKLLTTDCLFLFKDSTFHSHLRQQLLKLGFGELDTEYIQARLTKKTADLRELLKKYLLLEVADEAVYGKVIPDSDVKKLFDTSGQASSGEEGGQGLVIPKLSLGWSSYYFVESTNQNVDRFSMMRYQRYGENAFYSIDSEKLNNESFQRDPLEKSSVTSQIYMPSSLFSTSATIVPESGALVDSMNQETSPSYETAVVDANKAYLSYMIGFHRQVKKENLEDVTEYYKQEASTLTLAPSLESFAWENYRHYQKVKSGIQNGVEVAFHEWLEFLNESVDGLEFASEMHALVERFSNGNDYKEKLDQVLLQGLQIWINLHGRHPGYGTAEVGKYNPKKYVFGLIDYLKGQTLENAASTLDGNCVHMNAVYQYIMKKYYKIPARMVVGFANFNMRKNTKKEYSKDRSENAWVLDPANDGHAWSEALMGDSWMTFDATPMGELIQKGYTVPKETRKEKDALVEEITFAVLSSSDIDIATKLEKYSISLPLYMKVCAHMLKRENIRNGVGVNRDEWRRLFDFLNLVPEGFEITLNTGEKKVIDRKCYLVLHSITQGPPLTEIYSYKAVRGYEKFVTENMLNILDFNHGGNITGEGGPDINQMAGYLMVLYKDICFDETVMNALVQWFFKNREDLNLDLLLQNEMILKIYLKKYGREGFVQRVPEGVPDGFEESLNEKCLKKLPTVQDSELRALIISLFFSDYEKIFGLENNSIENLDYVSKIMDNPQTRAFFNHPGFSYLRRKFIADFIKFKPVAPNDFGIRSKKSLLKTVLGFAEIQAVPEYQEILKEYLENYEEKPQQKNDSEKDE